MFDAREIERLMKLPALLRPPAQMAAKVNIWQSDEYDSPQPWSPQFSLSSIDAKACGLKCRRASDCAHAILPGVIGLRK
jgi:hypothetical protein